MVRWFDYIISLWCCVAIVRNPPCEINIFVLQQRQNLERGFCTSKNASGPLGGFGFCLFWGAGSVVVDSMLIVTAIVGFCICSTFCVHYFMSILVLQSS